MSLSVYTYLRCAQLLARVLQHSRTKEIRIFTISELTNGVCSLRASCVAAAAAVRVYLSAGKLSLYRKAM